MTNVIIYKTGRQTLDFKTCRFKGSQKALRILCKEKGIVFSLIVSEKQLMKDKDLKFEDLSRKYGINKLNLLEYIYSDFKIEDNFDYESYEKDKLLYSRIGCQNKKLVFEWLKDNEIWLEEYTHVYDLIEKYNMDYKLTQI